MRRYEIYSENNVPRIRLGTGKRSFETVIELLQEYSSVELNYLAQYFVYGASCHSIKKEHKAINLLDRIRAAQITSSGEVAIRKADKPLRMRKNVKFRIARIPDEVRLRCYRSKIYTDAVAVINKYVAKGVEEITIPELVREVTGKNLANSKAWPIGTNIVKKFSEYIYKDRSMLKNTVGNE